MTIDEITVPGWAPTDAVIAAEQALIGSVIQSRIAAETVAETVQPADFYKSRHRLVFEAVVSLIDRGADVDPVSVLAELTRQGTVTKVGAGPALMDLMARAGTAAWEYAATVVRDDAIRRGVAEVGPLIGQLVASRNFDLDRDVDMIRQRLDKATARVTGTDLCTIGDAVTARLEALENQAPVEFVEAPYTDLQMLLAGLRPGQLVIIGARPSVGKSVIGMDIARNAAIRLKYRTLFFSLEMQAAELADRVLAAEAQVTLDRIRDNNLTDADWDRIAAKHDRILQAPLVVDDTPHCSLGRIRARLRGMSRTDPARLVIVDYMGLMEAPKADSRERQVAELSRGLKLLAKEFEVPIVALSQLNRESTKRTDRRPAMSELRDSGAVEQDADIVILLHREDAYDKESPRAGEMDLLVEKNRNGATGTIVVVFQGHYSRAMDMAKEWSPSGALS
ncbi:replicative DNA helicase [Actinomadura viridis]|uniref:DNA 5'-3' helicase n=1 Tax=Actinomadura viridis TaxID=58110 RepID=A0A931GK85_9ACTN|nr:replicative DNA helicase [Actinomadura viridis]MBG6089945.1 replicative DNA helicase [Actinomadura viridis]